MLNYRRLFKDYDDSGALCDDIAPRYVVSDHVIETDAGDFLCGFRITPADDECLDLQAKRAATIRWHKACYALQHGDFRIYQYAIKRNRPTIPRKDRYDHPVADEAIQRRAAEMESRNHQLYEIEHYLVLAYDRTKLERTLYWGVQKTIQGIEEHRAQSVKRLLSKARAFQVSLKKELPHAQLLDKARLVRLISMLVNLDRQKAERATLISDANVGYQIGNCHVQIEPDHLMVDHKYAKVWSAKTKPATTDACALRGLLTLTDGEMILCSEYKPLDYGPVNSLLHLRQNNFDLAVTGIWTKFFAKPGETRRDMKRNKAAESNVDDIGDALIFHDNGGSFGEFSLRMMVYGDDLDQIRHAGDELARMSKGFNWIEEQNGTYPAWMSMIPGGRLKNHRIKSRYLPDSAYADMGLCWSSRTGEAYNKHLKDEYLALFETSDHQIYYFNGHVGGVFSLMIYGAPEAGKSFTTNYLLINALKYAGIRILIMDIGDSYRDFTATAGGQYFRISLEEQEATINPFAQEPTEDYLAFLNRFLWLLMGGHSPEESQLQRAEHERLVADAVLVVYDLPPEDRRLGAINLPPGLRERLAKWKQGGMYGRIFDNAQNTIDMRKAGVTTCEFIGMTKTPDVLAAVQFYLTEQFDSIVTSQEFAHVPKLLVIDEGWAFMLKSDMGAYMVNKLKTGRKHDLWNIFITQSGLDAARAGLGDMINEACKKRLFLYNPGIKQEAYVKEFGLTEHVAYMMTQLEGQKQMLEVTDKYGKVLNLNVDEQSQWIYANDPNSNRRKLEVFRTHGRTREAFQELARTGSGD